MPTWYHTLAGDEGSVHAFYRCSLSYTKVETTFNEKTSPVHDDMLRRGFRKGSLGNQALRP